MNRRVVSRGLLVGAIGLSINLSLGTSSASPPTPRPAAPSAARECPSTLPVLEGGEVRERRCVDALAAAGLTAIDLDDEWAPYPLDGAATAAGAAPPAYRSTYVDLENRRDGGDRKAAIEGTLELYGIAPSLGVVLAAMDDDARHRCHAALADAALADAPLPIRHEDPAAADARRDRLARARARVDALRRRHAIDDLAALRARGPAEARAVDALAPKAAIDGAIRAIQGHLACDGLLAPRRRPGTFDWETAQALAIYQRRHWIVASGELDGDTREALLAGSEELDLRLALRALRVRVTDAAAILEDGSARGEWGTVLGRALDPEDLRYRGDYPPLPDGAADRVSAATEAAALALGWRDFESARASLRRLRAQGVTRVAIRLPPPPRYAQGPLEVRATIVAGDASTRAHASHPADPGRRPVLILYARDGEREVPLVRWPTTFGGWKPEKLASGAVVRRYKPSDLGPRVWRDLVVAPVWYAPPSTPDAELVALRDGRWTVKEELLGPGYRSAYGLAMLIHHQVVQGRDHVHFLDHGIRTHGSVSYRSILVGESHGCHRLYNHQMIRLATFLLRRRAYVARGPIVEPYARRIRHRGRSLGVQRGERGFAYELTPPIAIDVVGSLPALDATRPPARAGDDGR